MILSGPMLWLFYYLKIKEFENTNVSVILTIISTIGLTLFWGSYLKQKDKKAKGLGVTILVVIFGAIIGIGIFVAVVTKNYVVDYKFYNSLGCKYYYTDISRVDVGFNRKGGDCDFYYVVKFKDGKGINFYQAQSPYHNDTYLELEIFDNIIMKNKSVHKVSSSKNYKSCNFDKKYVDRFLRIINNK